MHRRTRWTTGLALTATCAVMTTTVTAAPLVDPTPTQSTQQSFTPHPDVPTVRCVDAERPVSPEEQYLERKEAARFIHEGGFTRSVARFQSDLCRARSLRQAERIVDRHSTKLWRDAVKRAQGKGRQSGSLSAGDDRPLYWSRLAMAATLRQWDPRFALSDAERQTLIDDLDRVSRGQDDVRFPRSKRGTTMLVTGFDPFTLFRDVRQANPSGATALALDGTTIHTADGPVRLEAAMFPVRWRDFEQGMVEEALLPHLAPGRGQVDAFATLSQGRPGQFDLEAVNGAWRGGFTDNESVCYRGMVPIPDHVPTVDPQPQWTRSTHPAQAMLAAGTGPFTVIDNHTVKEVSGDTPPEPVTTDCPAPVSPGTTRTDDPTPGSQARAGAGGDYLSNEIAYRATLLRDAVGAQVPGGHIHTPVLQGLDSEDLTSLSTPTFEANRQAIVDQARALIAEVARSTQ